MGVERDSSEGDGWDQETELMRKVQGRIFSKNKKEVFDYLLKDIF